MRPLRRSRLAALLAATVLLQLNVVAMSGNPPIPDEAERQLQDELRFRRDFGFDVDQATVATLMAASANYIGDYGVALTPAELADLQRRLVSEDHLIRAREYAQAQPSFAGAWMDQPAGGIIKIAFAGDAPAHRAQVEAHAPGSPVEVIDVRYTWKELEVVLEQVEAARIGLKEKGIWIRELGIDPRPNRVEIKVEELTDATAAELHARFGDAIVVEQSGHPTLTGCTDRYHCIGPPIRAGIAASSGCSLAFMVKISGTYGWLSAGHCASGVGAVWYHDGVGIGTVRANCWPNCLYSDALRAGELFANYSSYRVYRTPSSNTPVKAVQGFNGDFIGMQTCLNGRRQIGDTGWRCGVLDEINRVDYGTIYFLEQRYATYNAYNGDSGGAIHSPLINSGVTAYGVQSGCEDFTPPPGGVAGCETWEVNGRGIYSHIYRVRTELGVTICSQVSPCP